MEPRRTWSGMVCLLGLLMVLGGMAAAAEYGGGSGTAADPYLIATPEQLDMLGKILADWGKHFRLVADLDMSAYTINTFHVIGSDSQPFTGVFDGNNHIISRLVLLYRTGDYRAYFGLFGFVQNAEIRNLTLEKCCFNTIYVYRATGGLVGCSTNSSVRNCSVSGVYMVGASGGGLAGKVVGGTVENCTSLGVVRFDPSRPNDYLGGLIGKLENGTVLNCSSQCDVVGAATVAGGLVGSSTGGKIQNSFSTGYIYTTSIGGGLVGGANGTQITECYSTSNVVKQSASETNGYIGGLIGDRTDGILESCHHEGRVISSRSLATGGLIGRNTALKPDTKTIRDCYHTGDVYGTGWVGGLIGENTHRGTISDCHAYGTISQYSLNFSLSAGGLVGRDTSILIERCRTDGIVYGCGGAGGIAGVTEYGGIIRNCVSTAAVGCPPMSDRFVSAGGLVGSLRSKIVDSFSMGYVYGYLAGGVAGVVNSTGIISNCYSCSPIYAFGGGGLVGQLYGKIEKSYCYGKVFATHLPGGLAASISGGSVTDSFWDIQTSGQTTSAGGTGLNTSQMQTATTYLSAGWDFVGETINGTSDIWTIAEGLDYPRFSWQGQMPADAGQAEQPEGAGLYGGGSGAIEDPYLIYTAEQLDRLGQTPADWGMVFRLMTDIDLSGYMGRFHTLGNSVSPFTGIFDGNGHTIRNLVLPAATSYAGFFGATSNAVISNLSLEAAQIIGTDYQGRIGILAGDVTGGLIENCQTSGYISGYNVGGLAGSVQQVTVRNCSSNGMIISSGFNTGGLIGYQGASTVENCRSRSTVITGYSQIAGGLIGKNAGGLIQNCRSGGLINGGGLTGGLVGQVQNGSVISSRSTGSVFGYGYLGGLIGEFLGGIQDRIEDCHTDGLVHLLTTLSNFPAGGLIGRDSGGMIQNCSNRSQVYGYTISGGLVGTKTGGVIVSSINSGRVFNEKAEDMTDYGSSPSGGLVGSVSQTTITQCGNEGDVYGSGGLIGEAMNSMLEKSYNRGAVTGSFYVYPRYYAGGLCGSIRDTTVRNCYSQNTLTSHFGYEGGLFGITSGGSIVHCYVVSINSQNSYSGGVLNLLKGYLNLVSNTFWNVETSGATRGIGYTPVAVDYPFYGKTTAEMKSLSTFTSAGWDFVNETANGAEDIWYIREGLEYPRLVWEDQKPIANAGEDISIHCGPDGFTAVQLDGSGSSDADNDPLTYQWNWIIDQQEFSAEGVAPTIQLPLGTHEITLIVNDGIVDSEPNTVTVTVYNTAPAANAGVDITAYFGFGGDTVDVTLDGSGSSDTDGDALTYKWYQGETLLAEGVSPTVSLSAGVHTITLIVNDGIEDSQADEVVVTVVGPVRANMRITPSVFSLGGQEKYVWAILDMPDGISLSQLDRDFGYFMRPGEVKAKWFWHIGGENPKVIARFERDQLRPYLHAGRMRLTFYGRLKDGRYIGGRDRIWVINPPDKK